MRPAFSALATALCTALITPTAPAAIIQTAEPFLGVTHYQIIEAADGSTASDDLNLPRPLVVHLVEIDPEAEGISFLMQPGNGRLQGEVTRYTTPDFVNTFGVQIGINGDFYSDAGNGQANVTHTGVSRGSGYSPNWYTGQPIFNIDANNNAAALSAATPGAYDTLEGIPLYNAIGGNQRILTNGAITAPNDSYTNALNPHTALGVAPDGRIMLMTVDGRQGDFSSGMRTTEMAELFLHFGINNAINIDGGGSTTLAFDDSDDNIANARVINSPSDGSSLLRPGNPRLVANNLGVFATPNPNYTPLPEPPRPLAPNPIDTLSELTIIDDFNTSKGRFSSTRGVAGKNNVAAITTALDASNPQAGDNALRIDITNTNADPARMQFRYPSGGTQPNNNTIDGKALAPTGYVGLFIRRDPGAEPLFVSMLLDDGSPTVNGREQATFLPIIADGQWHLYQWNLENDDHWTPDDNGDGDIDGANTFIDSLYFSSAPDTTGGTNWSGTLYIDTVAHNPNGDLSSLIIPEPSAAAAMSIFLATLTTRRTTID
ncbi:phosphodiester glycosidase family protein [Mucisphaera sp.]|uniref:phosphodiester glycosidase family protein n=1 Tax=Mucisphaera sp. TaxID=2913024 RepID=UPI003D0D2FA1